MRTFERPEALTIEKGKYKDLLMHLRYSCNPTYAPDGIDASVEIMNVVEYENLNGKN